MVVPTESIGWFKYGATYSSAMIVAGRTNGGGGEGGCSSATIGRGLYQVVGMVKANGLGGEGQHDIEQGGRGGAAEMGRGRRGSQLTE